MNISKSRNLMLITLFVICITAPLADMVLDLDKSADLNENRERAQLPAIKLEYGSLRKFPHAYYNYFKDNFGFRDPLIRLNFIVRHRILGESIFNEVVFGENDWLFYTGEKSIEDSLGITHYDEETLQRLTGSLELKRNWLSAQGIKYLFVVVPNKETVYGEWFPPYLKKVRNRTGLDEFVDYLKTHTNVDVVDLRQALLLEKKRRVFYKTDTHWNEYGAFLAYREIMKSVSRWFPVASAETLTDFDMERKTEAGGGLAVLVGGYEFLKEEKIYLVPRKGRKAHMAEVNSDDREPFAMSQDDKRLPRALVFRDSFFNDIIPFISEQFQYARYYWQRWDDETPIREIIEETRPDIVIEEVVERKIKFDKTDFTGHGLP